MLRKTIKIILTDVISPAILELSRTTYFDNSSGNEHASGDPQGKLKNMGSC